jgi:hypothetical protein
MRESVAHHEDREEHEGSEKEKNLTAEARSTQSFGEEILFSRASRPNNRSSLNSAPSVSPWLNVLSSPTLRVLRALVVNIFDRVWLDRKGVRYE